MERMVVAAIELIWRKVVESFSTRVVDQMAHNALDSVKNIADFVPIFENLKKNLKSLSARAADVEEEMTNLEASGRRKRKREVEEWLEQVKSIEAEVDELGSQVEWDGFVTRLTDGGKAAQLNEQVKELVEQSRNFGELVLDVSRTSGDTFLTEGLVGQAFNKNLETILRLLESRQVSSIGVYGMGGVGKTTLAKHINNQLIQRSGGCVFWVTVSQEYTVRGLQDKIARLLGVDLSHEDEVCTRAMELHRALSENKNSVLILDDVWEYIDMKKVGCLFSEDGCRLIITTRSLEVCRRIGCQREIPVKILHAGEAWKLFKETLGTQTELDPEVEGIAKDMVKLCGGLPLGIITVAGSMRGKRGSHRWRHNFLELQECVKGKDGMGEDEDEVFEVLKFSFDRLKKRGDESNGFNMKQLCFLYCSLYPEDHGLCREDWVFMFISEGLVSERERRRARADQGHTILDELVGVCLLESYGYNNAWVKMHDLVRSMALRICKGKHMVRAGEKSLTDIPNEKEWTKDLEKVSFMESGIRRIEEGLSPDCPKLTTLLFSGNKLFELIPESFFSRMQGLQTLDLCYTKIRKLPNSVSDLTGLRALFLLGCNALEEVPYLGKLKELRELDLTRTAIKEVPQGLEDLLKLEFLSLDTITLEMLPSELFLKLVHLQHVSFPFHLRAPMEGIQNLKLLEEFFGSVEHVEYFNSFNGGGVSRLEYMIIVGEEQRYDEDEEHIFYDSYYKKNLGLFGCNLEEQTALGHDTEYVIIGGCEGLSISFLDYFPKIKKLKIYDCGGIECLLRSDHQVLPALLKEIQLMGLDGLKGVMMQREEIGTSTAPMQDVFSSLTSITIVDCNKMRNGGFPTSGVPNLIEIVIEGCREIEEIFEVVEGRDSVITLPKLMKLTLSELARLKKVGLPVSAVPNLEEIEIKCCREIEEIFEVDEGRDSVITLPELKKLTLHELERLKKVGLPVSAVPCLEDIDIVWCGEIEEIFEEDEGEDYVITLPKLMRLTLYGLSRLKKVGLQVSGVPNLEQITIKGCGEIEEIFEEEDEGRVASILTTLTLPLREMILYDLPRLKRVSKTTIISDSIETIDIRNCPILMKKLPLHMDDSAPPPSLRWIFVEKEWWELLEWDTNSNPNLPQLLLPLLQFL